MKQPPVTLFAALHRAYFGATALALALGGAALLLVSFATVRTLLDDKQHLVARTVAYSVEAAVVFDDALSAQEILEQIAGREHLVEASVLLEDGRVLARHSNPARFYGGFGPAFERLVFSAPASAPILHDRKSLGQVTLRGDGSELIRFVLLSILAVLLGLLLILWAVGKLVRRMERSLVAQLEALARFTRETWVRQDFERRLPSFEVLEFNALGQDFNALLGEIEARNQELQTHKVQLEHSNAALSVLALHDSLTGLANRAAFVQRLAQAVEEARQKGGRVGLLYLDNDHFKAVNDLHGHEAGDRLLVEVARRLRGCVREDDLVARLGGDEFTVLLAPLRDPEDGARVAGKILAAMGAPVEVSPGQTIAPSVSIGIAVFPEHALTPGQLMGAADQAMYLAKREKRGTWRFWMPPSPETSGA